MNNIYRDEMIGKIVFFIVGIYVMVKIFIPIIYPVSMASNINYNESGIYQRILDKSNAYIEAAMDNGDDDENKKELFSIIFKYLTNIDLSNPRTYITSQIPILQLIDITSIASDENGPVVVVPRTPEDLNKNNNTSENPPQNSSSNSNNGIKDNHDNTSSENSNNSNVGQEIIPGNIGTIKKMKLDPSKPLILIYHTHTTENYNPDNKPGENFTTDYNKGVCRVGEELKKELQNTYGIATIHDTTVHDIPKREGAYGKSRPTIEKYIKKYPSLKIIIDLHRDGDVGKDKATAIINDEKYARVMFVLGTKSRIHTKNEAFAKNINNMFEYLYPKFSKGLCFKKAVYNQDLSSKIVLIEVGSNENSLDEAVRSVKIIGRVLAQCISSP